MRLDLVLTVIGQDRPGLVELLSRAVTDHGGNWEASRMARMSGRFAGILQISVPQEQAEELAEAQRRAQDILQAEMRKVQPFPFNLPL